MILSQSRLLSLRLVAQNVVPSKPHSDRLVFPTALLLASLGVGLSSFSLKQLLSAPRHH